MSESTESEVRKHLKNVLDWPTGPELRQMPARRLRHVVLYRGSLETGPLCRFCYSPSGRKHRPNCRWRQAMEASVEPSKLPPVPYAEPPDHISDAGGKVEREDFRVTGKAASIIGDAMKEVAGIASGSIFVGLKPGDEVACSHLHGAAAQPSALDMAGINVRRADAAAGSSAAAYYIVEVDVPALLAEVERLGNKLDEDYEKECHRIIEFRAKIDAQAATIAGLEKEVELRQEHVKRAGETENAAIRHMVAKDATIERLEQQLELIRGAIAPYTKAYNTGAGHDGCVPEAG